MGRRSEKVGLFETKSEKGRMLMYRLFTASIFVSICFICVYRVTTHFDDDGEIVKYWAWIGLSLAELLFILYWLFLVVVRWNPIYRFTFKHNLSHRYAKELPRIDILVCTADPELEPPIMVVNTILSVMAYDYPPEKLSVYLSDDGGSFHMFYALLEAAHFSKIWLPFCKKFTVEPRSPEAYYSTTANEPTVTSDDDHTFKPNEWQSVEKSYEQMKMRIERSTKQSEIQGEVWKEHKGFCEWDFVTNRTDHQAILQILIDGREPTSLDAEGQALPTLVYLSREKKPKYHSNFKAGAMNSLLRVSSRISNAPVILNLDCDMYSNTPDSIRDALCFFMDEHQGHNIAFVQFPQSFKNLGKNDLYGSAFRVSAETELPGFDGNGGCCYIGTGCFHRRDTLCGRRFSEDSCKVDWKKVNDFKVEGSADVLEETCKVLATCTYEENTEWGNKIGFIYGTPVEDIVTGVSIQQRGWKSVYFNPKRKAFVGLGATTLMQSLIQHKRWSEGHFQIFLSRFCTLVYGHGRIPLKLQLSYFPYNLWAPNSLPTLYYVVVPSLCLLRGISLFPEATSPGFLPFAYVFMAYPLYNLGEFLWYGGTFQGWWNEQRMWVFRRITAYLFGYIDTMRKLLGLTKSAFAITAKVADEQVSQRYEQEIMEFDTDSPMFCTIISTIAMLNLFSLVGGLRMPVITTNVFDQFAAQIVLCGILVSINVPVYRGLFFRQDGGRLPLTMTHRSIALALLACLLAMY